MDSPAGATGPLPELDLTPRVRVFSIENGHGGQAVVIADSVELIASRLLDAKEAGGYAMFTRTDGEHVAIDPNRVFLVGEITGQLQAEEST